MKPTRRSFIRSIVTSAAWLGFAKEAFSATSALAEEKVASTGNTQWTTLRVSGGSEMRVYIARPEAAATKVPGVIVLQEAFGVNGYIQDVTRRIARLGYVAAAPELYHRTAPGFAGDYENKEPSMKQMQAVTDQGMEADLHAVYDWLKTDRQVDASHIGSVGYCMGGRASFFANAVLPLQAAVSYYGAGIAPTLLSRAKDQHAPILLFWGGQDTHIGRDKQNAVADALKQAGKPYTDIEFSDAEHGFFCDARKSYNPVAARESWTIFAAFLREHLGGKT
jgi:carboxymethylenebutenolidase